MAGGECALSSDKLTDQVILVTGGSRGIGREIVLGVAQRGAQVVFCARQIGGAAFAVQQEAERYTGAGRVLAVRADVSQEEDVAHLFDEAIRRFGRVDVVVNNAGISRAYLLMSLPTSEWDAVLATNLTGAFLVSRQAIKTFLAQGEGGQIISIGSITQHGAASNASYAASKGGLRGLTQAIACEYGGQGVRANLIVGGFATTDLLDGVPDDYMNLLRASCPQKREALPQEIASVVVHLAANQGLPMNGASLYISGGINEAPAYL